MKKYILDLRVAENCDIASGYSLLKLADDEHALPESVPGQFVQVRASAEGCMPLLRRPIGINFIDRQRNEMWILVHNVGAGTAYICSRKQGDSLNIVAPLGNGFTLPAADAPKPERELLIGGGVGTAPLLYLGSELAKRGVKPVFLLGGRSAKDILQIDDFKRLGPVYVTTEDASAGEKGFVTQHSILQKEHFDFIATCGPKPMMVAVAKYAANAGATCEASLENLMACGLGACLCCVEKNSEGHNVRVCKDGPVFNINQLTWLS